VAAGLLGATWLLAGLAPASAPAGLALPARRVVVEVVVVGSVVVGGRVVVVAGCSAAELLWKLKAVSARAKTTSGCQRLCMDNLRCHPTMPIDDPHLAVTAQPTTPSRLAICAAGGHVSIARTELTTDKRPKMTLHRARGNQAASATVRGGTRQYQPIRNK
jgi:hypothetical protein